MPRMVANPTRFWRSGKSGPERLKWSKLATSSVVLPMPRMLRFAPCLQPILLPRFHGCEFGFPTRIWHCPHHTFIQTVASLSPTPSRIIHTTVVLGRWAPEGLASSYLYPPRYPLPGISSLSRSSMRHVDVAPHAACAAPCAWRIRSAQPACGPTAWKREEANRTLTAAPPVAPQVGG